MCILLYFYVEEQVESSSHCGLLGFESCQVIASKLTIILKAHSLSCRASGLPVASHPYLLLLVVSEKLLAHKFPVMPR